MHVILVVALLGLVAIGFIASRIVLHQPVESEQGQGRSKDDHYSVALEVSADKNYYQQVYLDVFFEDSIGTLTDVQTP